jgi:hypothetical protein
MTQTLSGISAVLFVLGARARVRQARRVSPHESVAATVDGSEMAAE